jgi:hypothetical protein
MAYKVTNSKGNSYFLHSRQVQLKGGRTQSLFFFAKEPGEGALDALPSGYQVAESKNGLPVLKRIA